jgi:hypothetical protein
MYLNCPSLQVSSFGSVADERENMTIDSIRNCGSTDKKSSWVESSWKGEELLNILGIGANGQV